MCYTTDEYAKPRTEVKYDATFPYGTDGYRTNCNNIKVSWLTSSETQEQSVGSGEKVGWKFSSTGKKAPGYRISPNYFHKFKRMPAPDWAQKMLCIINCAQSANSFSWVLFVSLYTTAIVSPHLPGSFTKLVRARETFIFYFPNQKQRNYRWVEKMFGMLSAGAIQFAPRIFWFWRITMYHK